MISKGAQTGLFWLAVGIYQPEIKGVDAAGGLAAGKETSGRFSWQSCMLSVSRAWTKSEMLLHRRLNSDAGAAFLPCPTRNSPFASYGTHCLLSHQSQDNTDEHEISIACLDRSALCHTDVVHVLTRSSCRNIVSDEPREAWQTLSNALKIEKEIRSPVTQGDSVPPRTSSLPFQVLADHSQVLHKLFA